MQQASRPISFRPYALRRAHLRVLVSAMDSVQDYVSDPEVLAAAARFYDRDFATGELLQRYLTSNDGHSQFYPWLLWDAALDRGRLGPRLLSAETRAGGCEAEIAKALLNTRADVYQITRCDDDLATLERVADGALIEVEEPVLATVSAPGELLVARILDLGDQHVLDAVHCCLPPQGRRALVRAARKVRRIPIEEQLPKLIAAAGRAMRRLRMEQPSLVAPDGGAVVQTTLVFTTRDAAAINRRLEEASDRGLLRERRRDFVVAASGADLVGVSLRLSGDRLHATTSCEGRLDRLRERLEAWLPGLTYIATVYRDLDALLATDEWHSEEARELRRLGEQWLEEYLSAFNDRPQRTLGGVTPREAVRTARGRTKVRALLRSVQRFSDAVGTDCNGVVDSLWAELDR